MNTVFPGNKPPRIKIAEMILLQVVFPRPIAKTVAKERLKVIKAAVVRLIFIVIRFNK
jgi:hypothetical protein